MQAGISRPSRCDEIAFSRGLIWHACWHLQAKQTSYEELSAGQASQMARNETEIDRATEEMEDLEETLNESIAESIRSRQRQVCSTCPCPYVGSTGCELFCCSNRVWFVAACNCVPFLYHRLRVFMSSRVAQVSDCIFWMQHRGNMIDSQLQLKWRK